MARSADKTDSYISMVLSLKGRVRPSDLHMIAEGDRAAALNTFSRAHHSEMELHFAGDELVAGAEPESAPIAEPPAPSPEAPAPTGPPPPTDLTESGESAIDLLLGDYDGAPPAASVPDEAGGLAASAGPTAVAATTALGPEAGRAGAPTAPIPARHPAPDGSRTWLLWWVPTVLIPTLGGLAAWFFLRRNRQTAARAMLAVGLVIGIVASVLFLRYAEEIATLTVRATIPDVIVVPSKPAASGQSSSAPAKAGGSSSSSAGE